MNFCRSSGALPTRSGLRSPADSGMFDYAAAIKNAPVASRPEKLGYRMNFAHPSYEARLGMKPNEAWNFGVSGAAGPYLAPGRAPPARHERSR